MSATGSQQRISRRTGLLALSVALLTGCTSASKTTSTSRPQTTTTRSLSTVVTTEQTTAAEHKAGIGVKATSTEAFTPVTPADDVIARALDDLNDYWSVVFPKVYGEPWKPISGGYHPYTSTSELPPCPGVRDYGDVAQNAFYCPGADLVAWDAENLIPQMDQSFGDFSLGIVMAHEMGHAVQFRFGFRASYNVTKEQQADCFAGAWAASVANGHSTRFTVGLNDLDAAVAGFLQLRDSPGSSGFKSGAHGSAFDRIGSFQDGFEKGAFGCKGYTDQNVAERLVQLPFKNEADAAAGGNMPWEKILPVVSADLESFWSAVFAQDGRTWTPVDVTRRTDAALARSLYDDIGDFAAATVLGRAYAGEVQARLHEGGSPLQQSLQADCLTGSWAASMFLADRADATLRMSPGDLDKAVMALLASGDRADAVAAGEANVGTPFQRVASLRTGFMDGIAECAKITAPS